MGPARRAQPGTVALGGVTAGRIQLRRTKGWRKPAEAVVVSRPSKWGNPYRISRQPAPLTGRSFVVTAPDGESEAFLTSAQAVTWAVEHYESALRAGELSFSVAEVRAELGGRVLACWCPTDAECHGDVLLRVANEVRLVSRGPSASVSP